MRLYTPLLLLGLASTVFALPKGHKDNALSSKTISKPTGAVPTHSVFTDGPSFSLPAVPPRPPGATQPPPVPTGSASPHGPPFRNGRPPDASRTGVPLSGSPPPRPSGTVAPSSATADDSNKMKGKVGIVKPNH
ncbi:hypothetical protein TWF281_003072 [Arthrobotrys megalospora]